MIRDMNMNDRHVTVMLKVVGKHKRNLKHVVKQVIIMNNKCKMASA